MVAGGAAAADIVLVLILFLLPGLVLVLILVNASTPARASAPKLADKLAKTAACRDVLMYLGKIESSAGRFYTDEIK